MDYEMIDQMRADADDYRPVSEATKALAKRLTALTPLQMTPKLNEMDKAVLRQQRKQQSTMNKLEVYIQALRNAGLTEKQVDEAVFALNEYNNARIREQRPETAESEE